MEFAWFIWLFFIMGIWLIVYVIKSNFRKVMLKISLITMPFGLAEPLFVPECWFPPSLFDMANKTDFDIESIPFSFAIGGIGTVLNQLVYKRDITEMTHTEMTHARHRLHHAFLFVPPFVFALLAYFVVRQGQQT